MELFQACEQRDPRPSFQELYFLNLLVKQVFSVLNKDSSAKEKKTLRNPWPIWKVSNPEKSPVKGLH